MPICDAPFVLRSNKPCSKQSRCQWFGMRLRSCDDTIMTVPQSAILWMADSHLGVRNSVLKWLRPSYTELMWFYCNDNAAKRDFESQTAYSQFDMDIVIRSGIIYYKWPNLKRESLDVSIIWFWTNSQGTGDWDIMTHMWVRVMPMLQNAISQTPESHLVMNNLRSGIIYHKQLNAVFI